MRTLTKRLINRLFKKAVTTWFDEDQTLCDHVTNVFANAGIPISLHLRHEEENNEDEILFYLRRNLLAT